MILCGENMDVGGGGVGEVGWCPPPEGHKAVGVYGGEGQ